MLIQDYQPSWIHDFHALENVLSENITTTDIRIEHIGSTSVSGLAAKPIIDMDIIHQYPTSFASIKEGLQELGYTHCGDQGISGREVFKRVEPRPRHRILDSIAHHVYVCQVDCAEWKRHILFRDHLRKNEGAREAYANLKQQIARLAHQNKKEYAKRKEVLARPFIASILNKYTTESGDESGRLC
ncbi:MAG: GrpB family protein [Saprospiraceae bacterium]|nr:GrpB family protein [Saprospiraceae bacterium]